MEAARYEADIDTMISQVVDDLTTRHPIVFDFFNLCKLSSKGKLNTPAIPLFGASRRMPSQERSTNKGPVGTEGSCALSPFLSSDWLKRLMLFVENRSTPREFHWCGCLCSVRSAHF